MEMTPVSDSRDEPEGLGAFDRSDDHHVSAVQDSEVDRLLARDAEVYHYGLSGLKKNFLPGSLVVQTKKFGGDAVCPVGAAVDIPSAFEGIQNTVNGGLRHPDRAGHERKINSRCFALEHFQDVQRLVEHSDLSGTLGRRIHG